MEGYEYLVKGRTYFTSIEELDHQEIAFAELTLSEKARYKYKYSIVKVKDGELKPGLYVPVSQLPMHAGSATYDTGTSFVIPHVDHIHIVTYDQLEPEQIATIKYLMQHPEYRPAPWTSEDHSETVSKEIKYVPNVTPIEQRNGLKNWQIIHSAKEVNEALEKGIYATDEGYIFSVKDLLDENVRIWSDGSFSIPRADGKKLLSISKSELSIELQAEVDKVLKDRQSKADDNQPKEITTQELMKFIAKYYQIDLSSIVYSMSEENFVIKVEDAENIIIKKDVIIAAYNGKSTLPTLTIKETNVSELEETTIDSSNKLDQTSQTVDTETQKDQTTEKEEITQLIDMKHEESTTEIH